MEELLHYSVVSVLEDMDSKKMLMAKILRGAMVSVLERLSS